MERLSRDRLLMDAARLISMRGTCSRLQVGVVFSKAGRIVSTGYNGAPSGVEHCTHYSWNPGSGTPMPREIARVIAKDQAGSNPTLHTLFDKMTSQYIWFLDNDNLWIGSQELPQSNSEGCRLAGHAEANGIAFAARHGVNLEGTTATVTHMPCYNCALLLVNAGVAEVVYDRPYRLRLGVELLEQAGIPVIDFNAREAVG